MQHADTKAKVERGVVHLYFSEVEIRPGKKHFRPSQRRFKHTSSKFKEAKFEIPREYYLSSRCFFLNPLVLVENRSIEQYVVERQRQLARGSSNVGSARYS